MEALPYSKNSPTMMTTNKDPNRRMQALATARWQNGKRDFQPVDRFEFRILFFHFCHQFCFFYFVIKLC